MTYLRRHSDVIRRIYDVVATSQIRRVPTGMVHCLTAPLSNAYEYKLALNCLLDDSTAKRGNKYGYKYALYTEKVSSA